MKVVPVVIVVVVVAVVVVAVAGAVGFAVLVADLIFLAGMVHAECLGHYT